MMTPEFRRNAFRAAIAAAGYKSVSRWAADHGKNENQVYMVIARKRADPRTLMMIDAFIVETLVPFISTLTIALDIGATADVATPAA